LASEKAALATEAAKGDTADPLKIAKLSGSIASLERDLSGLGDLLLLATTTGAAISAGVLQDFAGAVSGLSSNSGNASIDTVAGSIAALDPNAFNLNGFYSALEKTPFVDAATLEPKLKSLDEDTQKRIASAFISIFKQIGTATDVINEFKNLIDSGANKPEPRVKVVL
jgi:hypothetical protein